MARLFNDTSSQYLSQASNCGITAEPMTFSCWFMTDDLTIDQDLVEIGISGTSDNRWSLQFAGTVANDPLRAQTRDTTSSNATITGVTANVWNHGAAVFAATNDRRVFLNGTKGTNAVVRAVSSGVNRTQIGARNNASIDLFFSGRIAEVAIWNVTLTDNEITVLSNRVSPRFVRPGNLKFYSPLYGVYSLEPDYSGNGRHMTLNNGPSFVAHSPTQMAFGFDEYSASFSSAVVIPSIDVVSIDDLARTRVTVIGG